MRPRQAAPYADRTRVMRPRQAAPYADRTRVMRPRQAAPYADRTRGMRPRQAASYADRPEGPASAGPDYAGASRDRARSAFTRAARRRDEVGYREGIDHDASARIAVRHDAEHLRERGEAPGRLVYAIVEQRPHSALLRGPSDCVFGRAARNQLAHLVVDRQHLMDGDP